MRIAVTFPDGTRVTGGRIADAAADAHAGIPDLGVYAHGSAALTPSRLGRSINGLVGRPLHAGSWSPGWDVTWIHWPDMGVPVRPEAAADAIEMAFQRARAGERVEVRCLGGKGRTGTMLACMAVLGGVPVEEAVPWVRSAYARSAVERRAQVDWITWFAERRSRAAPG